MDQAAPRGRKTIPIALKLMVATAVLLTAVAAAAMTFSRRAIHDLSESYAESRRRSGEQEIRSQATLLAANTAASAGLPLAEGNFTYLSSLVEATAARDDRITWILIADGETGRIVARSRTAPAGDVLDDPLVEAVARSGPGEVVQDRDRSDPTAWVFGANVLAGERVVGQVRIGISTRQLEQDLAAAIAAGRDRAQQAENNLLRLAAAALLVGLVLAFIQAYRTTRPLRALTQQAVRIAGGELHHRVDIGSRDEIGVLADHFNYMAGQLGVLLQDTATKASLEREMSLARDIQRAMHPSNEVIAHGPFRVAGYLESADACGGDWWTVRTLPRGVLLIVVGDVTGHGLPAAMITASARGALDALGDDTRALSPENVLTAIDKAVTSVGRYERFMTCFAAQIDPERGVIRYANAGHNFPYVLRRDDGRPRLLSLAAAGNPLGNPRERQFQTHEAELHPDDIVVFYTDGLVERLGPVGHRFGDKRLRKLLTARPLDGYQQQVSELRDGIVAEMRAFAGEQPADDDVTIVLCHYQVRQAVSRALAQERA